uniref:Uncharacterized protein n=1 Tax=Mesocestoides corti TaxID=53468 RepID=A0A5K3F998_MESCO
MTGPAWANYSASLSFYTANKRTAWFGLFITWPTPRKLGGDCFSSKCHAPPTKATGQDSTDWTPADTDPASRIVSRECSLQAAEGAGEAGPSSV